MLAPVRLLLAVLLALAPIPAEAREPVFDALAHLLSDYAGPVDQTAGEAEPETDGPPGEKLAQVQSDLSLMAEGFEAFRHPVHTQRALGDLPDHIIPELRPFFKDRDSTLDAVYRTMAVMDYTWALRFPQPTCDPRSRRNLILAAKDGLFTDPKSGDLSHWLSLLLGPSAGGRTVEEALDRASDKQGLSAGDYELVRVKVAKITAALNSEKAVGAERAKLYCQRAEAYESLASAHQASNYGPIQASRGSAAAGVPDAEAASVLILAVAEGPNRFRAVGAGVMVETSQGPKVLTDARLISGEGEDRPSLRGFARAKDGTLDKPRPFFVERIDRASSVMVGRIEEGDGIPALNIARAPVQRNDFFRAIGHMSASGAWTVSQGLVTETGGGTFTSDAILGPDMLGSPLLNDEGEVVGLVVLSPAAGAPVAIHCAHLRRVADGDLPAAKDLEFLTARQTGSGSLLSAATPFVGELSIPGGGAIGAGLPMSHGGVNWGGGGGVGNWRPKSSAGPPSGYSRSYSSPSSSYGVGKSPGTEIGEALAPLVEALIFKGVPALFRGIGSLFSKSKTAPSAPPRRTQARDPVKATVTPKAPRPEPPPQPPKPACELVKVDAPTRAGSEPFEVAVKVSCNDSTIPLMGHSIIYTFEWDGIKSNQTVTLPTDGSGVASLIMQVSNAEGDIRKVTGKSERSHDELDLYARDKREPEQPSEEVYPPAESPVPSPLVGGRGAAPIAASDVVAAAPAAAVMSAAEAESAVAASMHAAKAARIANAASAGKTFTLTGKGKVVRVIAVLVLSPAAAKAAAAAIVVVTVKQVFDIGWEIGSVVEGEISGIQRGLKQYDKDDCEEARRWQLDSARIRRGREHQFKSDWQAEPNSEYDICACKDGRIVIKRRKMCGKPGGVIPTDRSWK